MLTDTEQKPVEPESAETALPYEDRLALAIGRVWLEAWQGTMANLVFSTPDSRDLAARQAYRDFQIRNSEFPVVPTPADPGAVCG